MEILEQVRASLRQQRSAGVAFADAWKVALLIAEADRAWHRALYATRKGWADAYEGRPADRKVMACAAAAFDPERVPVEEQDAALAA